MNWQALYSRLLDGETVTVIFASDAQRAVCRTHLSRLRKQGAALLVLMDMEDTKLEIKKLDDSGKHSIRFAPREVKHVPFTIVEDSDG